MKKNILITDLDNTLFDWFDIWYGCFNAMLSKAVEISGIDRNTLIKEIRSVHQRHGTSEYSFVLEEVPSFIEKYGSRDCINQNLNEAIHAFRSERIKRLKLYPTVMDTLCELKKREVKIIGYTESKEYYSNYRIHKLGMDGLIDILYSPKDHDVPDNVEKQTKYNLKITINRHTPENELKPNPQLLLHIINEVNAKTDECVYIGDSEMKDILMAQDASVTDVFAKYGTGHFENGDDRYQLLRDVTHWTNEDVERERKIKENSRTVVPSYVASQFSDILIFF